MHPLRGYTPRLRRFWERLLSLLRSIRFRITLWFTFILALILVAFSAFIYYNQSRDIRGSAQYRLQREMAALALTSRVTTSGLLVPQGILQDTDVLVFLNAEGKVIASYGPVQEQEAAQLAAHALEEHEDNGNSSSVSWLDELASPQRSYIFVAVPMTDSYGQTGLVALGSLLDPYGLYRSLILTLLAGCLATLAVALAGGFWLADRAMRPVKTITQAAHTISETDLSRRLNMKSKDELGLLAGTFDAMLARLQAAFERQRQFVADASHELRTPLTIVNLETSRALASTRKPAEYQHALTVIRGENDFMSGLVNDLLMLARMDAGQTAMEQARVDLSDVVVETVERLMPLAARNGVTLETGNLPEASILGDRQYLIQMVSNLVENGIKYTTGEHKLVRVETGVEGEAAWVRVSDNGPGIAAEHLPHLFERFYRVDQSRTRGEGESPSGSGLGLSIVQWIAQNHGGEVCVESTVGVGTTFEVRFRATL